MALITTLSGHSSNTQNIMQVDISHDAARVSIRPLEHVFNEKPGGHYALSAMSGVLPASLAANSPIFSVRWAESSKVFALLKLTAGIGVYTAAQTLANPIELEAVIARGFTVDFSASLTSIKPASGSNKMRSSNMQNSILSSGGINIATTNVMTGQTYALDTAGFGCAMYPGNALGVAVTQELYKWDPIAAHPPILTLNEGIIIRNITALGAAATYKLMVTMLWGEVELF